MKTNKIQSIKNHLFKSRDSARRFIGQVLFDKKIDENAIINKNSGVVFVRWDAKIGDSYLFSSMYKQLSKKRHVTVVVAEQLYDMHKEMDGINTLIPIRKRPSYAQIRKIATKIQHSDIIIHMTECMKLKDLYFIALLNPKRVYALDGGVSIVNRDLSPSNYGNSFKEKLGHILIELDNKNNNTPAQVSVKKHNTQTEGMIIINPFGSNAHKSISVQRVKKLISSIKEIIYTPDNILILNSPPTKEVAEEIVRGIHNARIVSDINTIQDAIDAIYSCELVITVDTSIAHIASALGKPVVAIYPKREGNIWEIERNKSSEIVYSDSQNINPNLENFIDDDVISAIKKVSPHCLSN